MHACAYMQVVGRKRAGDSVQDYHALMDKAAGMLLDQCLKQGLLPANGGTLSPGEGGSCHPVGGRAGQLLDSRKSMQGRFHQGREAVATRSGGRAGQLLGSSQPRGVTELGELDRQVSCMGLPALCLS